MLTLFRNIFSPPRDMILVMIAFWIGLSLAEKRTSRYGVSVKDLNNITFYALLGFIFGGRFLYVIENLPAFGQNLLGILSLNLEIFDLWGGLVVAFLVAVWYGYGRNMWFWSTLDSLTLFFATIMIGLGLSHLASGQAFGKETTLPWGMELWGAIRHPSQVYETIASLLTLGLLWFRKADSRPGIYFLTFTALTSGWTLFLATFRSDSTLIFGSLRLSQVVAWIALAVSLFMMEKIKSNQEITNSSNSVSKSR